MPSAEFIKDFWSRADKDQPDHPRLGTPCWVWRGVERGDDYGHIQVEGKLRGAHRVAFWVTHDRWPQPCALHHCDNKRCVNPSHIYEGSKKDNAVDRTARGQARGGVLPGEQNPRALITAEQAAAIFLRRRECTLTHAEIAAEFGVSEHVVKNIVRGKTWKHITEKL